MISLVASYWIMVVFFSLIGAIRGWAREMIAMAGLMLSLFALSQVGNFLLTFMGSGQAGQDPMALHRRQFLILTIIHLLIAFFSYQGPTLTAFVRNKVKARDNVREKLLGGILGALSGYLRMGTELAFLEYRITATGYERLAEGTPYPFTEFIIRPVNVFSDSIFQFLPPIFLAPYIPILMLVIFLFVIIVMI